MSFFSRFKRSNKINPLAFRVVFHRDTRGLGMHGLINASHSDYNLDHESVRFTFMGLKTPPLLTPSVIDLLWQRAEEAGFIVHHIERFGDVIIDQCAAEAEESVSLQRKAAENRFHAQTDTKTPAMARGFASALMKSSPSDSVMEMVEEVRR